MKLKPGPILVFFFCPLVVIKMMKAIKRPQGHLWTGRCTKPTEQQTSPPRGSSGKTPNKSIMRTIIARCKSFVCKCMTINRFMYLVCCLGMFYQCHDVLVDYYTYPSVVSYTELKEAAVFPAATFCLSPWYNITQVCDTLPCSKKDMMALLSVPKHGFDRPYRYAGLKSPAKLFKCYMQSQVENCPSFDCTPWLRPIYFKVPFMSCYTLDLLVALPRDHPYRQCATSYFYELRMLAEWDTKSTMNTMDSPFYPIYFHESGVYSPESMYQSATQKGKMMEYSLSQQLWRRLEKPFSTDCWDYKDKYGHTPVFKGFMTRSSCEQSCRMNLENTTCGCVRSVNEFEELYEAPLCDMNDDDKCSAKMVTKDTVLYTLCDGTCNSECITTSYDARLSGMTDLKTNKRNILQSGFTASFRSSAVEEFKYQPALNVEGLFGVLTGIIGIWIGASFADTIDIFIKYTNFCKPAA